MTMCSKADYITCKLIGTVYTLLHHSCRGFLLAIYISLLFFSY